MAMNSPSQSPAELPRRLEELSPGVRALLHEIERAKTPHGEGMCVVRPPTCKYTEEDFETVARILAKTDPSFAGYLNLTPEHRALLDAL